MPDMTNNDNRSSLKPLIIGAALVAVVVIQFNSIASLRKEVASLRGQIEPTASKPKRSKSGTVLNSSREPSTTTIVTADTGDLESRLLAVEENMTSLNKNARHLMDRGQVPPDAEQAEIWKARFLEGTTPNRAMFETLRRLRTNDLFDDSMAAHAATLLSQSTNNGVTRALLDSLRGAKNPALKPAMLALAAESTEGSVRYRAVYNLREFLAEDPSVEQALWKIASEDKSGEVRRRAEESLRRVPLTDERQTTLAARVTNTGLSFDERWSALRVLGYSKGADLSGVAASLVQSMNSASDDETKLAYIRAFDDVNHDDFMLPLVNSVQDSNPEVRLSAADALVDYKDKDPAVMEWLRMLAKDDPDERVRKEAMRAFQRQQQRRRR